VDYKDYIEVSLNQYQSMIDAGIAPEQARMVLPQSMRTSYYVTGSLAAFARAYKQRIDGHSQREIQILAEHWANVIEPLYPISWSALTEMT
jgi:thymidylate synthase (FAD)